MTPRHRRKRTKGTVAAAGTNERKRRLVGQRRTLPGRPRSRQPLKSVKRQVAPPARRGAAYDRALHALALMRRGESLSAACKAEHIKPQTFLRYVGNVVRHDKPGGRFRVAKTDRLVRHLQQVQSTEGAIDVDAKWITRAREFSDHANAIAHFNRTGDTSRLKRFEERTFSAFGRRYTFLTDPAKLIELVEADALHLDSLYASISSSRK